MLPLTLFFLPFPALFYLTGTGFQGVADPSRAYQRDTLVDSVLQKLASNRFVIVQSPPASGKTSLLQLIAHKCARHNIVKYIRLKKDQNPYETLRLAGIDVMANQVSWNVQAVILIDDAQNAFSPELNLSFWPNLLKDISLPEMVRFIVASTYLIGGQDSPAEFANLPRIAPDEMLLDAARSFDFLVNFLKFPFSCFQSLVEVIIEDCGGSIGALSIVEHQYKTGFYASHTPPNEQKLTDYFISPQLTLSMVRLFGSDTVLSTEQPVMIDLLYNKFENIPDVASNVELKHYIKCGLLSREETGKTKFTNAMSRRYFIHKMYPQTATSNPLNTVELVLNSIGKISATTLRNSVVPGLFPKEAVFQHLMMGAMMRNLTAQTHLYPENSVIIGTGNTIKGSLDFFINGNLRWGIELMIKGRKLQEHRERFIGNDKYVALGCLQHVVVDFKGKEDAIIVDRDNLITVVFTLDDYRIATCSLPDGTIRTIELSP